MKAVLIYTSFTLFAISVFAQKASENNLTRFVDTFIGTWSDSILHDGNRKITGNEIGTYLNFKTKEGQQVLLKVGISMVSTSQAAENVGKEIPDWNFNLIKSQANSIWEKELNKSQAKGMSDVNSRIFYTALYHSLLCPSDWTGENPVLNKNRPYYEDFLCVRDIFELSVLY